MDKRLVSVPDDTYVAPLVLHGDVDQPQWLVPQYDIMLRPFNLRARSLIVPRYVVRGVCGIKEMLDV